MYLQTQPNNSIRASRSTRKRKDLPSGCIGANITKDFSIWAMLAHAQGLYLNVPANMLRQTIIGLHLLPPYGLFPVSGSRDTPVSFFTYDKETRKSMLLPNRSTPAIYARADLVTNWYKRNLRILTNLNRVTEMGKDRVLLLIGFGHLAILRQLASDSNYFCVVDPEAHLK